MDFRLNKVFKSLSTLFVVAGHEIILWSHVLKLSISNHQSTEAPPTHQKEQQIFYDCKQDNLSRWSNNNRLKDHISDFCWNLEKKTETDLDRSLYIRLRSWERSICNANKNMKLTKSINNPNQRMKQKGIKNIAFLKISTMLCVPAILSNLESHKVKMLDSNYNTSAEFSWS